MKDEQWCYFCSEDSKCASSLKFLFRVRPDSDKIQIKPVKDASFVDLSPADSLTYILSVAEDIPVWAHCNNFGRSWQQRVETKGCFDIEGGIQPKIQDQTSSH